MSINFNEAKCQTYSTKKIFGICDDPSKPDTPAYLDEKNGEKWIAVVENEQRFNVKFTAIDYCIETRRDDGRMDKRCDGMLTYNSTVIFVELKERKGSPNAWIKDAEEQLKTSIRYFEKTDEAEACKNKKAFIANSKHPKFNKSWMMRTDKFMSDTSYILRIENRIKLE